MTNKENKIFSLKSFGVGFLVGMFVLGCLVLGAVIDRYAIRDKEAEKVSQEVSRTIVNEESVVVEAVEKVSPSVVTVSISKTQIVGGNVVDPFGFWGNFFGTPFDQVQPEEQKIEQDIGSGFIITSDGLVVTNKHVVADTEAKYKVITSDDQVLEVSDIYRDPMGDLAILKVNGSDLVPVEMGDSDQLKVGQTVIAIGTALGEFRSTVTTGVISGLGRGIDAGSPYQASERLDNVIQTDAAINPGNSGGPLLNSAGQVIGVSVAVSQSGQNIGFALPINIVKSSIDNFKTTGEFERPFLGVSYRLISEKAAILNEVPQGAYVETVVEDGGASKAGIKVGDIITEIDGNKMAGQDSGALINIINTKKIGDTIEIKIWREGKETSVPVKLEKRQE